ncbi:asparagine--tRNA ligase [Candidatus Mycoplasma haematohominis]|uniref:Asparagine--tRNA ligase n=1 Tax=Candidatus Mycoplasma haematohominis TaxID=1494318 RepID=A0A478FSD0_9MOLU|nr:asparagine--tRNA ligase [Candidatus Mycoplasma haemohominis]GCE63286.1 asparagine--tRNA ligase [Candidatus Mycoplasma haemohominis]
MSHTTEHLINIKKILKGDKLGEELTIRGWVKSHQLHGKTISFIRINDGSTFENLQITYRKPITDISIGSAIEAHGKVVASKGEKQDYEFAADKLTVIRRSEEFPIQKKGHSFEYLREIAHIRHRTGIFTAVNAIKNGLNHYIHKFFYDEGFFWIQAPIITGNNCEGGAEAFVISDSEKFFKKKALLSVSGQFHAEALALGLHKVYTFGPTFRAEKSNTSNHLAEFWMIEPEIAFCDLNELMHIMEHFMKTVIKGIMKDFKTELLFLSERLPDNLKLLEKLDHLVKRDFERLEYKDAIEILKKGSFEVSFGDDLSSEQEKYITETFDKPVFVYNYPKKIKSFYMKEVDGIVVSSVDLLVPGVGELMGGSERESTLDLIEQKAREKEISIDCLSWYVQLRRYGYHSSAGFGCGFERLVLYATGLKNIKDAITYPRCYNQLDY